MIRWEVPLPSCERHDSVTCAWLWSGQETSWRWSLKSFWSKIKPTKPARATSISCATCTRKSVTYSISLAVSHSQRFPRASTTAATSAAAAENQPACCRWCRRLLKNDGHLGIERKTMTMTRTMREQERVLGVSRKAVVIQNLIQKDHANEKLKGWQCRNRKEKICIEEKTYKNCKRWREKC